MILDVSRWQGKIDWKVAADAGVTLAALRATVGNYYTDPLFAKNWDGAKAVGINTTAYHVVTPEHSASSQMLRFASVVETRSPDIPWVLDCELTRGQTRQTITDSIWGCIETLVGAEEEKPIIYTRASWFNWNVLPSSEWSEYDLWIARYASKPWFGDTDLYKPRDWDTWYLWQYTNAGNGRKYGAESTYIDENIIAVPPPPTLEERVSALEAIHNL